MVKILFLNQKSVGEKMSGLGVRIWESAKILAKEHQVTVMSPGRAQKEPKGFTLIDTSFFNVLKALLEAEIIICPIYYLQFYWLFLSFILRKKIIVDAYFPFYLENLEKYMHNRKKANLRAKIDNIRVELMMRMGDHFLCSSERQRELWLDQLGVVGRNKTRLNVPINIVPSGIRPYPTVQNLRVLRGVVNGLGLGDKLVLWFSGVWPWLDPISAIKAMGLVKDPTIKLVFFGLNPLDPFFEKAGNPNLEEAIALAEKTGLKDKTIFFIPDRVPYEETANVLLDADVALNIHHDHLETKYAYRGRILEYIWANIPIVATKGDVLSAEIDRRKLGIVVDYENETQIAAAILRLLADQDYYSTCKNNLHEYAKELTWERACAPLAAFCQKPFSASDNRGLASLAVIIISLCRLYLLSLYYLIKYSMFSAIIGNK